MWAKFSRLTDRQTEGTKDSACAQT